VTYSYHIDGPLPLSGKYIVSRHSVLNNGTMIFDKELNPKTLEFVRDNGMCDNFFLNPISAANALATALGREAE